MKHKILLLILPHLTVLSFFVGCGEQENDKPYPLDYCLVGGSDLGDMGEPVSYIHKGQEFKFCCKPCIPKFKKNPEKYIQELKEETEDL
jgi:YHS domain-containing protein